MSWMLNEAYRRVSARHGGLTRSQIMDRRCEVHQEINQIAIELICLYVLTILALPLLVVAMAFIAGAMK